ncbi:hypothetical protein GCM10009555_028890 [Acrocarpospora macrocephala]|uniref:Uncharacterized protein n=1 Tax=Acrocarpospora macrocephala TaxID=150177 RepID=A0A5M3WXE4_9ACTN|nr:hypothetical protein [Acrocarpospora macrocephala]GES11203.1 hypothetical protein Amac_048000 [Acrocarpospora macrocephala]
MSVSRAPVPLTEQDREFLEAIRTPGSPENLAIQALEGQALGPETSTASALHTLVDVARKAVLVEVMTTGYAALAAAQDEEDSAFRRAARRRAAEVAVD